MKKKTLRKIIISLIIITILISAGVIYLNEIVLPVKVKSLIIQTVEKETQKKAAIGSIYLNIFKGIVLRDCAIFDGATKIISIQEISCRFLLLPILKDKKFIIESIHILSPVIRLERLPDNTFNIQELFPAPQKQTGKSKFSVLIYKIVIKDGKINFQDSALSPPFTKAMEGINVTVRLALPASVKFDFEAEIPSQQTIVLSAEGEYKILEKLLTAKLLINRLNPAVFLAYQKQFGLDFKDGLINSLTGITLKDNIIKAETEISTNGLSWEKEDITASLDSLLKAGITYKLSDKQLLYSGKLDISRLDISGIEKIGKVNNLTAAVNFNQDGLNSDNIKADILNLPVQAKLSLKDFKSPRLTIKLLTDFDLKTAQKTLAEQLSVTIPVGLTGKGELLVNIEFSKPAGALQAEGALNLIGAQADVNKDLTLSDINGKINFDLNSAQWEKLIFNYAQKAYSASGDIRNFKEPEISLSIFSDELSADAKFNIKDKLINFSELKGKYLDTAFSLKGTINTKNPAELPVKISAAIILDLKDLQKPLAKYKDAFDKAKLAGILHADIKLAGNIKDWKSCAAQAAITSPSIGAYGLKSGNFNLEYNQEGGIGDISSLQLNLYEGVISAASKINLLAKNIPFKIDAAIQDVRLQALKLDTPLKDKDISGNIQARLKLNGFSSDISKLSGAGRILISEGKLWDIDLFKGIGQLLFTKEFSNVVFNEASCDFVIQDKFITTEDLKLTSSVVILQGQGKVGFDSSLDARINATVNDNLVPDIGTFKDITTAIIGQAAKFGEIRLSGTIQKPKYKFHSAVKDVIRGLTDLLIQNIPK